MREPIEPASRAGEPVDGKNVICPRAEDADPRIEVALQELMLGRSVPRRGPENVGSFDHGPAVRRYAYRCPSQLTVLPQQRIVTPSAGAGQAAVERRVKDDPALHHRGVTLRPRIPRVSAKT